LPTICCSTVCNYLPTTTVCRVSAGNCDKVEYCTASSSVCPPDQYESNTTNCAQLVGFCDTAIARSCPGDGPRCFGPPQIPLYQGFYYFDDFNVISFGHYYSPSGDTQGRMFVCGDFVAGGGYNIGLELRTDNTYGNASDNVLPMSLVVGGSATWPSGSLHPTGNQGTPQGVEENMYVGYTFNGPSYLADRIISNAGVQPMAPYCQTGRQYYTDLQNLFANLGTNARAVLMYGNGLFITCDKSDDVLYHLKVDDVTISKVFWYSFTNCNFYSRWILDITGTGDVQIQGSSIPGIVERLVYNVLGSGRNVNVLNSLYGNLLAPNNNLYLPNGVTVGNVVVGNVSYAIQHNKPLCKLWNNVRLGVVVVIPVKLGDTIIFVANLSNLIVGDTICNSGCQKITAFYISQQSKRVVTYGIGLSGAIGELPAGGMVTAILDPNLPGRNEPPVISPFPSPTTTQVSSASALYSVIAMALMALLL